MFNSKSNYYFTGVLWFILSLFSSSINDVISKYIGNRIGSYEITFFRFFFSALTLVPFIFMSKTNTLKTSRPVIHIFRGVLLFLAIAAWTQGLKVSAVTTATVVSFTVPIFLLIFSAFALQERIIWQRWFVSLIALFGLVLTIAPTSQDFNINVLLFVFAAIAFAVLDIINKKFVIKESLISMLFFSSVVTFFIALPFAYLEWVHPNLYEIFLLLILGASANLILFCLLKSFMYADVTALAPYRYLELIISATIAYLVFSELPSKETCYGALIVVPCTLFIIYSEKKKF